MELRFIGFVEHFGYCWYDCHSTQVSDNDVEKRPGAFDLSLNRIPTTPARNKEVWLLLSIWRCHSSKRLVFHCPAAPVMHWADVSRTPASYWRGHWSAAVIWSLITTPSAVRLETRSIPSQGGGSFFCLASLSIHSDYDFLRFGTVQPEVVSLCPVVDVREFCNTRSAVLRRQNHIRVVGKFD